MALIRLKNKLKKRESRKLPGGKRMFRAGNRTIIVDDDPPLKPNKPKAKSK